MFVYSVTYNSNYFIIITIIYIIYDIICKSLVYIIIIIVDI